MNINEKEIDRAVKGFIEKMIEKGYTKKEEVISSLGLDRYLCNYINDEENCLMEKIIMSNYLDKYTMKKLYVVEFIRDGCLYLRVENEKDEIVSTVDMFLGEITEAKKLTIEDCLAMSPADGSYAFTVRADKVEKFLNLKPNKEKLAEILKRASQNKIGVHE
jgi:DNA-directed RNA polymerase subunit N (RpoN/RPB10)